MEELGRGGMGTVYKAYQPSLDRFVAIKVLPALGDLELEPLPSLSTDSSNRGEVKL